MTLAVVVSWGYGIGSWDGVAAVDDDVLAMIERTVNAVETSGDDYAMTMVRYVLGIVLQLRDHLHSRSRPPDTERNPADVC